MSTLKGPVLPTEQLSAGKSFFASLGLDTRHFAAVWHVFKIAQLMETDLNRLSRQHGVSLSDFHLLSALMMRAPSPLRATDLAYALNLSNSALSVRMQNLARDGLLTWSSCPHDKRAKLLLLTERGRETVVQLARDLEEQGRFARLFRALPPEDRACFDRIAGELHGGLARDFLPVSRSDV